MCGDPCTPFLVILGLHGAEKFFDSYLAWRVKLAMFHEWHKSITDYSACEKLSSGDTNFVVPAIMFQREAGVFLRGNLQSADRIAVVVNCRKF